MAGTYTRARAPLVRKYTDRIFESKDGTTSMKIMNYIERHNFCCNDLYAKSNRTEIQTYEVEERTFGTPCIRFPAKENPNVQKGLFDWSINYRVAVCCQSKVSIEF